MTPARPRPFYTLLTRGLWKLILALYVPWALCLGALLYFRIVGGMPTKWYVPLLITLMLSALVPCSIMLPIWLVRLQRRVKRAGGRICPNCLYDLAALGDAKVCPECGWDLITEPPEVTWANMINRGKPLAEPTRDST